MHKYLIIAIVGMILTSCGFKGPLYLPKNTQSADTTKNNTNTTTTKNVAESTTL